MLRGATLPLSAVPCSVPCQLLNFWGVILGVFWASCKISYDSRSESYLVCTQIDAKKNLQVSCPANDKDMSFIHWMKIMSCAKWWGQINDKNKCEPCSLGAHSLVKGERLIKWHSKMNSHDKSHKAGSEPVVAEPPYSWDGPLWGKV
jgi:hypothetical protein